LYKLVEADCPLCGLPARLLASRLHPNPSIRKWFDPNQTIMQMDLSNLIHLHMKWIWMQNACANGLFQTLHVPEWFNHMAPFANANPLGTESPYRPGSGQ
jgi:hypothetical protein